MRYIATREGVEKLAGNSAVTKGQRELIQKLLHDFPDAVNCLSTRTTAKRRRSVRLPHLSVWHWMLTFTK